MPKIIDEKVWEDIKNDYLKNNKTYEQLASEYPASLRSIQKRGSDEGWAELKKAQKVISISAGQTAKTQKPKTPSRSRTTAGSIDEIGIVQEAIEIAKAGLYTEFKSGEGCASVLVKLIELHRKINPPSAGELADMIISLNISPAEFVQELRERWGQRA